MVALYRSGRQGDALRTYGEARDLLGAELGIEPSQSLKRLEEAILLEAPAVDQRFAVATGASRVQPDLPPLVTPSGPFAYVGRDAEQAVAQGFASAAHSNVVS